MQQKGQGFVDAFMLAMGIILGLVVGLIFLVNLAIIEGGPSMAADDPEAQAEVAARLAPVGEALLVGDERIVALPAPAVPTTPAQPRSGQQVYDEACSLCHADPGVGGAPVFADAAAWSGRVPQGMDTLTEHVIDGFQGGTGVMPPKGGRLDLSDDEVRAAVQYMVDALGE